MWLLYKKQDNSLAIDDSLHSINAENKLQKIIKNTNLPVWQKVTQQAGMKHLFERRRPSNFVL